MAQVSDFNVANASGASVRSDINAILEAIKTCNSGGSDPSNAEQFMFYGNLYLGDVAINFDIINKRSISPLGTSDFLPKNPLFAQ